MTEKLKMDVQSRLNDLEDAWFDRVDAESLRRIEARVRSRRVKGAAEGEPQPSDAERDLRQLAKVVEIYKHVIRDGCSACPAHGDVCENTQGSCHESIADALCIDLDAIVEKWGGGR